MIFCLHISENDVYHLAGLSSNIQLDKAYNSRSLINMIASYTRLNLMPSLAASEPTVGLEVQGTCIKIISHVILIRIINFIAN